jgi:type II secretory pathway predicted ATPase ExeA
VPVEISLPPVVGDPAGMRALAASLRSDAAAIAVVAADAASTVEGLEFYGPAAHRIDGAVTTRARGAGRQADRLLAVAGLLDRSASEVEAAQRERERKLEQLRRELAPRAVP